MCSRCRLPCSEELADGLFKPLKSFPKPRPPTVARNLKCERHPSTTMASRAAAASLDDERGAVQRIPQG
jgi:hypothetical protein